MKKHSNSGGVNGRRIRALDRLLANNPTPNKRQKKEIVTLEKRVRNKVKVTHKSGVPNVFTVDLWK